MKSYHGLVMKRKILLLLFVSTSLLSTTTEDSNSDITKEVILSPNVSEKKIHRALTLVKKSIPFFIFIGSLYYKIYLISRRTSAILTQRNDVIIYPNFRNFSLNNTSDLARAIDLSFAAYDYGYRDRRLNQEEQALQQRIELICASSVPKAFKEGDILDKYLSRYKPFFDVFGPRERDLFFNLARGSIQQRTKFEKIVGEKFLSSLVFYIFLEYLKLKENNLLQNKNFKKLIPALNHLFEANIFSIFNYEYLLDYLLWGTNGQLSKHSLVALLENEQIIWKECGHWTFKDSCSSTDQCKVCNKETCSICLDESPNWQTARCQHKFHLSCIYRWMSTESTCPVCRRMLQ